MKLAIAILTGFAACAVIAGGGYYRHIVVERVEAERREAMRLQTRPKTADIKGFDQVVRGSDGQSVTFDAYLDEKGICGGLEPERKDVCTIRVFSSDTPGSILVRIRICSDATTTDCLRCRDKHGEWLDLHEVRAISSNGDEIDFRNERRDSSDTGSIQDSRPLRLTGRVTVVDGIGRIIEPIEKINPVDTNTK